MKVKRDPRDDVFSKLVRCRAGWACEVCGKYYGPGHAGLHCSHLFGRRKKSVRWHPLNGSSMCYFDHQRLGESPRLFSRWITEHLGSEQADHLESLANMTVHWKKPDLQLIHSQLKSEWKRVQKMRDEGFEGRVEFSIPFVEDL